jgi:hypothetical protein
LRGVATPKIPTFRKTSHEKEPQVPSHTYEKAPDFPRPFRMESVSA